MVLTRILDENYVTQAQYDQAPTEHLVARYHTQEISFSAPYLSEMMRQKMITRYGDSAYTDGYKVYTTITKRLQLAAQKAVRNNVLAYDMRHGYRGPSKVLWRFGAAAWDQNQIVDTLKNLPHYGPLVPAVITAANAQEDTAMLAEGSNPDVNSALVSINPNDGAVKALVGGFDFNQSKFNRITQALRQVGSNIKPFLYTAAFDKGMTLATILNDLPITRWDAGAVTYWRPKNSPPTYAGPIRLRQGLGQSKNVVMVRVMRAMGVDYAAEYLQRFGFPAQNICTPNHWR